MVKRANVSAGAIRASLPHDPPDRCAHHYARSILNDQAEIARARGELHNRWFVVFAMLAGIVATIWAWLP
jgi:hypothetical protein